MFAKIFESIYDGTLADHWQGMVTFQQLLILSNSDGVVDMTPAAIARKTGIPREIIDAGLAFLEQPDPQSRTKTMEGRRIARLSDDRDWGWFLVNHAAYRARISREEKREADRIRIAAKRATGSDDARQDATCRDASQKVADVAHSRVQITEEARAKDEAPAAPAPRPKFKPPAWVDGSTWTAFLEMRRRIKKPATDRACSLIVAELVKLRHRGHDPTAVLEQSIRNSWQDVYEIKTRGCEGGTRRESAADRAARLADEGDEREAAAAGGRWTAGESGCTAPLVGEDGCDLRPPLGVGVR